MTRTRDVAEAPSVGGTWYAVRRAGLALLLLGVLFAGARLLGNWLGCPGQYVTGVPCDIGARAFPPAR